MQLIYIGFAGLVVGFILTLLGRRLALAEERASRKIGEEEIAPFFKWFLDVLKKEWPKLTGIDASTGERVTALGSLVSALSVLIIIGGIISSALGAATGH
jgi:uncharacterized membrane protein